MSTNKLTDEKKAAMKAKREANPQFAHLSSAARRKQIDEFKKDAKANFIQAKRNSDLLKVGEFNAYENEVLLKAAKTFINKLCKDSDLLTLSIKAVKVDKKTGNYSPYKCAQLVQKVVRLCAQKDGFDYVTALNYIIAKNKA